MHQTEIQIFKHHHNFNLEKKSLEKRTFLVVLLTLFTMIVEIITGWIYNSIALFSDGWHMSTHAAALSISLFAYILARKYSNDESFTFGTWKIEILGAYTSAILLGIVGIFILFVSIERIFNPLKINYEYALIVAIIGLLVNLISAFILGYDHENYTISEDKDNEAHQLHKKDLNLRSAYLHVVADAMTSFFAILALLGVKYYNWKILDPIVGVIGSILIFRWTYLLIKDSSGILLDRETNSKIIKEITEKIESDGDSKICDLHLLRVSQNKYACILSIIAKNPSSVDDYKKRLKDIEELVHLNIEINLCK
ncbi:MAG: CDF family Co(II)/Ni(II) efflux transporter DmeF [Caldisericia bacterium]|jgi:cation diffusion facilitator family transporter|nr:CDF family Co(II)/Ni(II) efflux transporter DmeF [Caldisericia bacterium]